MLKVNEIWRTINGEGRFSGVVVKFIRLSGCNVYCPFCNAKYCWHNGVFMSEEEILHRLTKLGTDVHVVVISGGEPLIQDTTKLLGLLKTEGYYVVVETNGTIPLSDDLRKLIDWLVVSPKTESFILGDELRLLYRGQNLVDWQTVVKKFEVAYLVPLDAKPEEIEKCIHLVQRFPDWYLGLPIQYFWGKDET